MLRNGQSRNGRLTGHALRNAHLRERALERARSAPPLAAAIVKIRAELLGMTRLEFSRRSGISRGTLRDLELGIHTPTRRILQRFVAFCEGMNVARDQLEQLRRLYVGIGETLEEFIARLELRAGSPRELARRVDISPTTLWEYRRGNFPLPLPLLKKLCRAVGEKPASAETLWHAAQRRRLLERGYPEALAEFWVLCLREGYTENRLLRLGLTMATVRRLRYLEVPSWPEVAGAITTLCRDQQEQSRLRRLWREAEAALPVLPLDGFGARLQQLRLRHGVSRRELADLFGIGGRKPARIIKYIEEDGFHSTQAFPAGLAAVLSRGNGDQSRLLRLWHQRRHQFYRRRRPEMRVELRLARDMYGFSLNDIERILGYASQEYQRIERGVSPLLESAQARILDAIHQAGQDRIEALLQRRRQCEEERLAWRAPASLPALVVLLAAREGGLIPLTRVLRQAGLKGLWAGRLRAIAQGCDVPAWPLIEQIARACGVSDVAEVRRDWESRYRARLESACPSPLGVELRLLIAARSPTLRAFSPRLGFNYSVLVRDLQRIDRDEPVRWFHVERILRALPISPDDENWREIHALWYTTAERSKRSAALARRPSSAASSQASEPRS